MVSNSIQCLFDFMHRIALWYIAQTNFQDIMHLDSLSVGKCFHGFSWLIAIFIFEKIIAKRENCSQSAMKVKFLLQTINCYISISHKETFFVRKHKNDGLAGFSKHSNSCIFCYTSISHSLYIIWNRSYKNETLLSFFFNKTFFLWRYAFFQSSNHCSMYICVQISVNVCLVHVSMQVVLKTRLCSISTFVLKRIFVIPYQSFIVNVQQKWPYQSPVTLYDIFSITIGF